MIFDGENSQFLKLNGAEVKMTKCDEKAPSPQQQESKVVPIVSKGQQKSVKFEVPKLNLAQK